MNASTDCVVTLVSKAAKKLFEESEMLGEELHVRVDVDEESPHAARYAALLCRELVHQTRQLQPAVIVTDLIGSQLLDNWLTVHYVAEVN